MPRPLRTLNGAASGKEYGCGAADEVGDISAAALYCSAAFQGETMTYSPTAAPAGAPRSRRRNGRGAPRAAFWALTIGSVGVVYGDIGTSPLYAFREAVTAAVGPTARDARGGARRALADPVGADRRGHAQIRAHPAACGQQRGGRHARADGAGAARRGQERRRGRAAAASSARRCSTATPSSRRRFRCCPRSKASSSSRRRSNTTSCR